jgi:hypothetical protein
MVAHSKIRTASTRSNAGVLGSSSTHGMDICVLISIDVVLCRQRPSDGLIPRNESALCVWDEETE